MPVSRLPPKIRRPATTAGSRTPRPRCVMGNLRLLREYWAYMRARKRWWLLPIIVVLLILGSLVVLAEGSALAPFIYTIF